MLNNRELKLKRRFKVKKGLDTFCTFTTLAIEEGYPTRLARLILFISMWMILSQTQMPAYTSDE